MFSSVVGLLALMCSAVSTINSINSYKEDSAGNRTPDESSIKASKVSGSMASLFSMMSNLGGVRPKAGKSTPVLTDKEFGKLHGLK